MNYVIYQEGTGKILRRGVCPKSDVDLLHTSAGEAVIEAAQPVSWKTHYVADGEIIERPEMALSVTKTDISADGTDSAIITGLPSPASVTLNSETYDVLDGVIEITVEAPGVYAVKCTAWPYRDKEITVNAR